MDSRLEISEALMDLSRASERVAKLLAKGAIPIIKNDAAVTSIGNSTETINFKQYQQWPDVKVNHLPSPGIDLNSATILQFANGPTRPILGKCKKLDLITDSFVDPQPEYVKIIKAQERAHNYDIGIVWESLEFCTNPASILQIFKQCCKKTYIRFRPWSGQDGAFLNNKAFIHLITDTDHTVQWKVIRPLATYETLIKATGMVVLERHINTSQVDQFISENHKIMQVLRDRTWGETIRYDEILKIMATDSVDYVLI